MVFRYGNGEVWEGWVPVECRRTGLSVPRDSNSEHVYLEQVYEEMDPAHREAWLRDQENFWKNEHPKSGPTKEIFDVLAQGGCKCVNCDFPQIELFREYTDCLYPSYGTKWNGNAAAYNGSLYVVQDNRIRRLSPLECERLMGFPDGYTDIPGATRTTRYQALGNSWAVPVIRWIGERLSDGNMTSISDTTINTLGNLGLDANESYNLFDLTSDHIADVAGHTLNTSVIPSKPAYGSMVDIVDENPPPQQDLHISNGVLRHYQTEERA